MLGFFITYTFVRFIYICLIIFIVQSIKIKLNSNVLYFNLKSFFIKVKNVSLFFDKSKINQINDIKTTVVKGIHKTLNLNDVNKLPLSNSRVALPIPQPGQGNPVISLNIHKVTCL